MASRYPPVGFHFTVQFDGFANAKDVGFQSVKGLTQEVPNSGTIEELGETRFKHRLPVQASYGNLTLVRGMLIDSGLIAWFKDAIEDFKFKPINVTVILLNENHDPLQAWQFINAWPTKWAIDGFDAEKQGLMTDTIDLSYQYFTRMS